MAGEALAGDASRAFFQELPELPQPPWFTTRPAVGVACAVALAATAWFGVIGAAARHARPYNTINALAFDLPVAGLGFATVTVEGDKVIIRGTAPGPKHRRQAAELVRARFGPLGRLFSPIRVIEDRMVVVDDRPDTTSLPAAPNSAPSAAVPRTVAPLAGSLWALPELGGVVSALFAALLAGTALGWLLGERTRRRMRAHHNGIIQRALTSRTQVRESIVTVPDPADQRLIRTLMARIAALEAAAAAVQPAQSDTPQGPTHAKAPAGESEGFIAAP